MEYEPVIGLEVHAQLATGTKLFCDCSTKFGSPPNTQTCPVCLGLPGVLPVTNGKAFEYALRTALVLNCQIDGETRFDRKNYYYPDLPKNYQISQNYNNLGVNGHLDLDVDGETVRVGIHNVHLEEDAGKLIHPEGSDRTHSLVDLNRTGVPLVEIVSTPDMHSVDQVRAFMTTLASILEYIGVCDCKMQEGSLRFEASISLRPKGEATLGNRVEIKNLNSMRFTANATEHEIERQTSILEAGARVARETRLWDEAADKSVRMRSKELAHDYRYFPEPDLVPITITTEWLEEIRKSVPELPTARRRRFVEEYQLPEYDAGVLTEDKAVADYFEEAVALCGAPKTVSNWVMAEVLREVKERKIAVAALKVSPEMLADLIRMVEDGKTSRANGKEVFAEMAETGKSAAAIVGEKGLEQISDQGELDALVDEVVEQNPEAAEDIRNGKKKAMGFLVGQIMRQTKGKADAKLVNQLLTKKLAP